ncbi:MAG: hypothetical protein ACLPHP_05295 [Candidatus Sulfotelmatobacter sp.]
MLIIRSEQIEIFRRDQLRQFEDDMVVHLWSRFGGHPLLGNEERLRSVIREAVSAAASYGLVYEVDVRRFVEFILEYGTDFPLAEWAAPILNDARLSGSAKMDRIDDYTVFVLRTMKR